MQLYLQAAKFYFSKVGGKSSELDLGNLFVG